MPPISLRSLLFVRELAGGDSLVFPVADPTFASFGPDEDVIYEQRVFLAEHLARERPEVVARHSFPEGTSLRVVRVLLPREDLPRKLQIETPIAIPIVVVPTSPNTRGVRDSWVFVVPLDATVYVPAEEDIDLAVAAEVKRLVFAQERTALEYLRLLPADRDRLETVDVEIERDARGDLHVTRKALAEHEAKRAAIEVLASVGNRVGLDHAHPPRPFIGRQRELGILGSILGGKERMSAVVVGPSSVGKSALFRAWVQQESAAGRNRIVFATSGAQLIAGMSGLGQWQERARRVMEAAERVDAVLFLDDLGDLFADRGSGAVDLPGFLKPYIEDGRVRLVGELKADQLDRAERTNGSFCAALSKIVLGPETAAEAATVLRAHIADAAAREPLGARVEEEAIPSIVDLAERYLPYEAFPGKAVRLLDELRATERPLRSDGSPGRLGARAVVNWFSLRTGIPTFLLRDDDTRTVGELTAKLERRLIGQADAVRRIAETICVVKAGVQPEGKPLATFFFVGPTGVGKTELARALAELLFGASDRMIRFDMSEYSDGHAAARLFQGDDRGDGLLTRQVREQPFSVVLLDEIEKAHPAVFDLLLQVCGEGRLTDGKGRTAYFHNAIVILTSNVGASHRRGSLGFDPLHTSDEAHYLNAVQQAFRPELVNRIDRVVPFRALTRDEVRQIARLAVRKVGERMGLADAGLHLEVEDAALDLLAEGGFSSTYGARALRRHTDDVLAAPIARLISGYGGMTNATVFVRLAGEGSAPREEELCAEEGAGFRIAFVARAKSVTIAWGENSLRSISSLRREHQRHLLLDRVEQLKDRIGSLVAQLGHGLSRREKEEPGRGAAIAAMQVEYHRLAGIATELDGAFSEICSVEELGIEALFAGEAVEPLVREARTFSTRFRGALVRALVADESNRNDATLLLQETGDGRALDHWLIPLLRALPARSWTATLHLFGGERDPSWPATRKWGSPRTPAWGIEQLQRPARPPSTWLLRVSGPNAGIFLALESGLHRIALSTRADNPPGLLSVALIARRSGLRDEEWSAPALGSSPPLAAAEFKAATLTRDFDGRESRLSIFRRRASLELEWADYWPRLEDIALAQLLAFENDAALDRETALAPRLQEPWDDVRALLRKGRTIEAIKKYRERTGLGLREARDAIEEMSEGLRA